MASFVVFLNQQIAAVRAGDTGDTGEAGPARLLAAGHQLQSPGPALGNIELLITQSLHGASRDCYGGQESMPGHHNQHTVDSGHVTC